MNCRSHCQTEKSHGIHSHVKKEKKMSKCPGSGCTTTSQPIYCQGGRKSTSLVVQLGPDALTSQRQFLPCNPPFGIVTVLSLSQPRCTDVLHWVTISAIQTHLLGIVTVSILSQPRCTDVPDWVTTSAMQPTFWDSDSFNFKSAQMHWRPRLSDNFCHATHLLG